MNKITLKSCLGLSLPALAIALCSLSANATPFTPIEWQKPDDSGLNPKFRNWTKDLNQNFIDDDIDFLIGPVAPDINVDVILDLNGFLSASEINQRFSAFGTIQAIGNYLTYVSLTGVRLSDISDLASDQKVAMVELQPTFDPTLDTSTRAIKARASTTYPQALGLTGSGINIAIIDSGVDNGHATFAGKFVGGYNAVTGVVMDPDDNLTPIYHGSHVAGIALGKGSTASCRAANDGSTPNTCAGVAPGSGLVDIKVFDPTSSLSGTWPVINAALDKAITMQYAWNIKVMNLSIGVDGAFASDGSDVTSQMINGAVARGIVTAVSAGNSFKTSFPQYGFGPISSASLAITIAASDDLSTVNRVDDLIANFSNRGPRIDLTGTAPFDALKPDIAAPGVIIFSAKGDAGNGSSNGYQALSGTSMASPHVAGSAALVLQKYPQINPGSLKDLLKRTAETAPTIIGMGPLGAYALDPKYNRASGNGEIDVFAAINTPPETDVKFPSCINGGGPPCWLSATNTSPPNWANSMDITLDTVPQVGVANNIRVKVRNDGTTKTATNVKVTIGYYDFTAGNKQFHVLATQPVPMNIPPLTTVTFVAPWTPTASDVGHRCVQASIDYGLDSKFDNNITQRNIDVAAALPHIFNVKIQNNLTMQTTMVLKAVSNNPLVKATILGASAFPLDPFSEGPREITVLVDRLAPGEPVPATPNFKPNRVALVGGVTMEVTTADIGTAQINLYAETKTCDVPINGVVNGKVDRNDISVIFSARNTRAEPADPRDPNGDGKIDVNDSRRCVNQCDKPNCEI